MNTRITRPTPHRFAASACAAAALLAALAGLVSAGGPVVDIPPASLPSEAFFAANPGTTVNVLSGGTIFPDGDGGAFTFNGATVNIETGGGSGFFTIDSFVEDVTYYLDGGTLVRTKFVAATGSTFLNITDGIAERGLWLQGNTVATMTDGFIGDTAQGQASVIVEDAATFAMSGGEIENFIIVTDSAHFELSAGTIGEALIIDGAATAVVSGGSTGIDGRLKTIDNVLTVTGGTIGEAFVLEGGTVFMSGGAFDDNAGMIKTTAIGPVFNMSGGVLGPLFRAYGGTMNISGGTFGDRFRIGTPAGDGSGITVNLLVKTATLDGIDLPLSTTPAEITVRGGEFLSCTLADDSSIGIILNEFSGTEDYVRAGAVLTVALAPCAADFNGDGDANVLDVVAFITLWSAMGAGADYNEDGTVNILDVVDFIGVWTVGCP